jgi:DNA polymerase-3 subunit epsilon
VRQRLHEYLLERPGGASPRELLDLVFTQPGTDPEFGPRFLHGLLACDPRFVWRPADGKWSARLHEALARPLGDTTFVIVDLETTGMTATASGIIEIGAARVRNGRVIEEFAQLVNPGLSLPRFITHLTGIDDAMLAGQPPIAAVWPRFSDFLGDAVIVAHNARFDLAFLNAAAVAYSGRPLANPCLCTLKLARRLVPELRRRGLDALAAHFGIPLADRHRALGDVRITVEVLFHLLERLATRGVARLDQALDLQHHARDGRRFVCLLPREKVGQLPTVPGIYQFFDANGRLLYIGKARNLRERVSSYLSNAAGHANKTLDLIRHSVDVRVQIAGSALEAALEEAEAIRRHKPPYNRLNKHLPRIAFVKLTVAGEYPRLAITSKLGTGPARYVGPFRSREEAERVQGLLTRLFRLRTCSQRLRPDVSVAPCFQGQIGACTAPCAARVAAADYRRQVNDCLALLDGNAEAAERELTSRRDGLAAAMRFEAAAKAQRDLDLLHTLVRRQRTLGWVAARQHFLILQPTADRRAVLAYVVLSGRLAARSRLHDESQVCGLAAQVRDLLPVHDRTRIQRHEVDGTTIVAAWLRDRGETEGCVLPIETAADPATRITEWRAACASLLPPAPAGVHQPAPSCPDGQGQSAEQPETRDILSVSD